MKHSELAIQKKIVDKALAGAGWVRLDFGPRKDPIEFSRNSKDISVLKWLGGKKGSTNLCIQGENLASLAALKTGYSLANKQILVDLIYIDPPYNVGGNHGYKNTWKGASERERDWAGDHGAFLDFMEPRLKIGRSLLSEEGIIFVSICDQEFAGMKILMNQIFGESNEIATFIWNKKQGASSSHVATIHEYVLCYAKNKAKTPQLSQPKESAKSMIDYANTLLAKYEFDEAQKLFKAWVNDQKKKGVLSGGEAQYSLIHPAANRVFRIDNSCAHDDPKGKRCRLQLKHPKTKKLCPVPKNGWKWKEATLLKLLNEGRIYFGKDHTTIPTVIKYLDELMVEPPQTVLDMSSSGKFDLPKGIEFATPKPVALIKKLVSFYPNKNCLVLDYFAGSGTTAAAIHEQNNDDGGQRSWILIEELKSTFNNVLLPRVKNIEKSHFGIFELQITEANSKELLNIFQQFSFDFFSAYHNIDENNSKSIEGMYIVGYDRKSSTLVAMITPPSRKCADFFRKEVSALKQAIKEHDAKKVLIYSIESTKNKEEPWIGNDKSLLSGTSCKLLNIVKIPEQLTKEWKEVLSSMSI